MVYTFFSFLLFFMSFSICQGMPPGSLGDSSVLKLSSSADTVLHRFYPHTTDSEDFLIQQVEQKPSHAWDDYDKWAFGLSAGAGVAGAVAVSVASPFTPATAALMGQTQYFEDIYQPVFYEMEAGFGVTSVPYMILNSEKWYKRVFNGSNWVRFIKDIKKDGFKKSLARLLFVGGSGVAYATPIVQSFLATFTPPYPFPTWMWPFGILWIANEAAIGMERGESNFHKVWRFARDRWWAGVDEKLWRKDATKKLAGTLRWALEHKEGAEKVMEQIESVQRWVRIQTAMLKNKAKRPFAKVKDRLAAEEKLKTLEQRAIQDLLLNAAGKDYWQDFKEETLLGKMPCIGIPSRPDRPTWERWVYGGTALAVGIGLAPLMWWGWVGTFLGFGLPTWLAYILGTGVGGTYAVFGSDTAAQIVTGLGYGLAADNPVRYANDVHRVDTGSDGTWTRFGNTALRVGALGLEYYKGFVRQGWSAHAAYHYFNVAPGMFEPFIYLGGIGVAATSHQTNIGLISNGVGRFQDWKWGAGRRALLDEIARQGEKIERMSKDELKELYNGTIDGNPIDHSIKDLGKRYGFKHFADRAFAESKGETFVEPDDLEASVSTPGGIETNPGTGQGNGQGAYVPPHLAGVEADIDAAAQAFARGAVGGFMGGGRSGFESDTDSSSRHSESPLLTPSSSPKASPGSSPRSSPRSSPMELGDPDELIKPLLKEDDEDAVFALSSGQRAQKQEEVQGSSTDPSGSMSETRSSLKAWEQENRSDKRFSDLLDDRAEEPEVTGWRKCLPWNWCGGKRKKAPKRAVELNDLLVQTPYGNGGGDSGNSGGGQVSFENRSGGEQQSSFTRTTGSGGVQSSSSASTTDADAQRTSFDPSSSMNTVRSSSKAWGTGNSTGQTALPNSTGPVKRVQPVTEQKGPAGGILAQPSADVWGSAETGSGDFPSPDVDLRLRQQTSAA